MTEEIIVIGGQKIIYKDRMCDAKWKKKSMTCQKGTLRFTGDNVTDFRFYGVWCKDCDRIKIIDRSELQNQFKIFAKVVQEVLEG